MKGIFFVSNGYGEDSIAVSLVSSISRKSPEIPIHVLPLVGAGKSYESLPCTIVGPRTVMPSGGVIPGNLPNLVKDTKSGLISLTFEQLKVMAEFAEKSFVTVTVGDIYPTILGLLSVPPPRVMVATAKSNYVSPHNIFERFLMKTACRQVFVRDEPTAEDLRRSGVRALWVGNAMMDCLAPSGFDFNLEPSVSLVAIFPGSRESAFADMPFIVNAVELIDRDCTEKLAFAAGIAPSLDARRFAESMSGMGWAFKPGSDTSFGRFDYLVKDNISITLLKGAIGDLLSHCKIVIGQAGTANEQAVGLGRPVVTFDSYGKNGMGWYRKRQKGLLGDSISVVEKDSIKIAGEVCSILSDGEKYKKMASIGVERMGPSGGADKMADYIISLLPQE